MKERNEDPSNNPIEIDGGNSGTFELAEVMSAVLENEVVGIGVLDGDGTYSFFNRGAETLTGYTRADVLGRSVCPELFSPEDRERVAGSLKIHGSIENMEMQLLRKDGSTRDIVLTMSTRRVSGKGYIQFFMDNTEKKHVQDLLMHAQKMEVVSEMAGGVAENFNSMLEGILGYTKFMMDLIEESHELQSYLEIIERSTRKAYDLTSRLLDFSKGTDREKSLIDCNSLLREVVKLLDKSIGRRIVVELNLDRNIKETSGSPVQLEQAFMNICLNARDAMPEGGKLIVSSENVMLDETYPRLSWNMRSGDYVRVSISDTGIGMDRMTQGKIFEPFFTTKKKAGAIGLGLNIAYGIVVTNHGGFINVYSEEGHGSVFNVYLPARAVKERGDKVQAGKEKVPQGGNELVLLIDDERIVRELGREMLGKLGYRSLAAAGISEGLRLFRESMGEISLVIVDMIMPGGNGLQVLDRMREMKPDLHVLISSGYNERTIGGVLETEKNLDFIQKPYSMDQLGRKVHELLGGGPADERTTG